MQGHGQTGQQENQEAARGQIQDQALAPDERGRHTRWAAAGRQVYARAALAAGARELLLPSACALCGAVQRQVVCAACAARQVNLRSSFRLTRAARLDGLHVALVDDVMTSSATLHEAAVVLKAHGAARVSVIVALRTP